MSEHYRIVINNLIELYSLEINTTYTACVKSIRVSVMVYIKFLGKWTFMIFFFPM